MRIIESKQIFPSPYEREVLVEVTCDICGQEAPKHALGTPDRRVDWEGKQYSSTFVMVSMTEEEGWSDGSGSREYVGCDICPGCFETKIVPLLKEKFGIECFKSSSEW
jgi:hypothetical protein